MKEKTLADYKAMQERCCNCSYCKWIPLDKIKSNRFAYNCPANAYFKFNTYSARGRFQAGLAVANEELDYTEGMTQMVHSCLSCGACDVACKISRYNLEPLEHNIALKADVIEKGHTILAQKVMLNTLATEGTLIPNMKKADRAVWSEGLGFKDLAKEKAEVLFFPGCKYGYDKTLKETLRTTVSLLLNMEADLGVLGESEMCCGGRAWQMGFEKEFSKTADINISKIQKTGAKIIVTPCADCYHALKRLYAERGLTMEVLHVVEYIDRKVKEGRVTFTKPVNMTVTYHDPCHLGRQGAPFVPWNGTEKKIFNQIHTWEPRRPRNNGANGIYDAPRNILEAIPGIRLVEMERIREYSWCCGAGGGCGQSMPAYAEWVAGDRVAEAKSTATDALVTACPWCNGMLSKAVGKDGETMPVYDLLELVARAL